MKQKVLVIGGGAAGFFGALRLAELRPDLKIIICEKSTKFLSKVKISGGGRCNVTHACYKTTHLLKHYPRGNKLLKQTLPQFMPQDMVQWLEKRGVQVKTEADGRIFPQSDNSQTIIDCFLTEAHKLGIRFRKSAEVSQLIPQANDTWEAHFRKDYPPESVSAVLIASGGSPKMRGLEWLASLGHNIIPPLPSLFTFNIPKAQNLQALAGVSVKNARVKVLKTKLKEEGALLVTHWGMSGPAVLRLSAWGARILAENDYHFTIQVNWLPNLKASELSEQLIGFQKTINRRQVANESLGLPKRLWHFLLEKASIKAKLTWGETGQKTINRLLEVLQNDQYQVEGKTTFKEEFVTCGGVAIDNLKVNSLESKTCPNLFFAGEILDMDGITGGFNFQAAWSTAWAAAQDIAIRLQ